MATFNKPYSDAAAQIAVLMARGMAIPDPAKAKACLERIGYYRLSGYWYPMRSSTITTGPGGKKLTTVNDAFRAGASFHQAVDLYVFDKRLRILMLDAIERVEIGLRVAISDLLGKRDPLAHKNPDELHGNFSKKRKNYWSQTEHDVWLGKYRALVLRSSEDFIKHFKTKYPQDELPIWMASEVWDFGALSKFLAGMKYDDQRDIASKYGIPRPELLISWIRALNGVRNACAHHSRLWNKPLVDNPSPPKIGEIPSLDHIATNTKSQTRLYYAAAAIQHLLKTINPSTTWSGRLKTHCSTYPTAPGLNFGQSGFPLGWESLPLWN